MKYTRLILGFAALVLLGAGCFEKQQIPNIKQQEVAPANSLPMIDILSPGLSSTTKAEKILVSGTTNRDHVWIGTSKILSKDGAFQQAVDLKPGTNSIPVSVSNGVATTTITINVARETAESTPNANVTPTTKTAVKNPTVQAKTTSPTTKTDANPSATQLKVEFVGGGELALNVAQEPNGVTLTWGKAMDPFQTYVIVKSTVDAAPYFPKQFWVKAINDVDVRTWRDTNVEAHKTTYYRVCKIKPDQSVACGNVSKVTLP